MELLFIFGRILSSSFSSVFQKQLSHHGLHPFYIVATTYFILSLLAAPLIGLIDAPLLGGAFWINVCLASLLDVAGWMFLVISLSKTDLSVFGPLNAYKVVISTVLGVFFLGEIPSTQGIVGVAAIMVGSFFLTQSSAATDRGRAFGLLLDRGVQARFLSIILFSVGTVFLKNSVMYAGPFETLIFWSLFGLPLILLGNAWFIRDRFIQSVRASYPHLHTIVMAGVLVFLMQYLTLVLLSRMLVAYALALFQLGMLLQVVLGHTLFNEGQFIRRLLAGSVMMAGSSLVLMA
ncbi:EamA family transporter [Methylolobus aquaticus]